MARTNVTNDEIEELRGVAKRVALKWLARSGGHEAEDVAQDAIVDYLTYASGHEINEPQALMRVIAKRRAMKYQQKWKELRRPAVAILIEDAPSLDDDDGHHALADIAAGGQTLERFENLDSLTWAITQLQAGYRSIAELTYLGDQADRDDGEFALLEHRLDAPTVAERLGLAEGTVRNRLVKIRAALQVLLSEDV